MTKYLAMEADARVIFIFILLEKVFVVQGINYWITATYAKKAIFLKENNYVRVLFMKNVSFGSWAAYYCYFTGPL